MGDNYDFYHKMLKHRKYKSIKIRVWVVFLASTVHLIYTQQIPKENLRKTERFNATVSKYRGFVYAFL